MPPFSYNSDNFIDINKIKINNYKFSYQIQTDGISCSLLFIRNDLVGRKYGSKIPEFIEDDYWNIQELKDEELKNLENRKIIGCDPGKKNLVYMIDEFGNTLKYTAPQRSKESKAKRNRIVLQNEKYKNKINEIKISQYNSKTVNYEKFKIYLKEKKEYNEKTRNFYNKDTWRKMKFRNYSYSKKSLDKFINKIQKIFGENILIAYGNWSRDSQMKNFMPTMGKGLRKIIHKKYDTITIDEFNTSKNCCECYNELKNERDSKGSEIFRLLKCNNCVSCENKKITFRTRDKNSAINILNLCKKWILSRERPKEFCRKSIKSSSPVLQG